MNLAQTPFAVFVNQEFDEMVAVRLTSLLGILIATRTEIRFEISDPPTLRSQLDYDE